MICWSVAQVSAGSEHQPDLDRSGIAVACHSILDDIMQILCHVMTALMQAWLSEAHASQ